LQLIPTGALPWRNVIVSGSLAQERIPAGDYMVKLSAQSNAVLPPGYFIKSITSDAGDLRTQPLKVGLGKVPQVDITLGVSPPAWVKVSGRVTGGPAPSATASGVRLEGPAIAMPLTTAIKPDGSYEFPAVLPGTYVATFTPGTDSYTRIIVVGKT